MNASRQATGGRRLTGRRAGADVEVAVEFPAAAAARARGEVPSLRGSLAPQRTAGRRGGAQRAARPGF